MTEKKTQNKTCDYMHLKHLYSMYVFCSELVSSVISIPDPLSNPTIFFFIQHVLSITKYQHILMSVNIVSIFTR